MKVSNSSFNVTYMVIFSQKNVFSTKYDPIGPHFRPKTGYLGTRESKSQTKVGVHFGKFSNIESTGLIFVKKSCAAPKFTASTPILPPKGLFGLRSQEKFYGTERSVPLGFASLITEQRVMGILTAFILTVLGHFMRQSTEIVLFFVIFGVKWLG